MGEALIWIERNSGLAAWAQAAFSVVAIVGTAWITFLVARRQQKSDRQLIIARDEKSWIDQVASLHTVGKLVVSHLDQTLIALLSEMQSDKEGPRFIGNGATIVEIVSLFADGIRAINPLEFAKDNRVFEIVIVIRTAMAVPEFLATSIKNRKLTPELIDFFITSLNERKGRLDAFNEQLAESVQRLESQWQSAHVNN